MVPLERNFNGHPFAGIAMGKKIRRSLIRTWMGANTELGMYVRSSKPGLFLSVHVDDITMTGQEQNMAPMWKKLMKNADPDESTSFHDHVYFGCTQRECKQKRNKYGTIYKDVWITYFCRSN